MKYEVKKLELRGVLDQTCEIIRDNQKLLFGIMAVSLIPAQLVLGLLRYYFALEGQADMVAIVTAAGAVLIGLPTYVLASAAATHAVANLYLSRPTSMGESYKRAFRRFIPMVLTSILQTLAIFGGFLLFIIPGILFGLWLALAQVVVVLEETSGVEALKRSRALMKGNVVNLLALSIILWYFNVQIEMSSALIPNMYVRIVLTSIFQGLSILVSTACTVIFYVSARCQHDRFDLQWLASKVAEPLPEAA